MKNSYSALVLKNGWFQLLVTDSNGYTTKLTEHRTFDGLLKAARDHAGQDIAVPLALS